MGKHVKQGILTIIATLFMLGASFAQEHDVVVLRQEVDIGGIRRTFSIPVDHLRKLPDWAPETETTPLPVCKAIGIAKKWVKKQHPKFDDFALRSIETVRISWSGPKTKWFYVIRFEPILDGQIMFTPGAFFAVILMDGNVVVPAIEESITSKGERTRT